MDEVGLDWIARESELKAKGYSEKFIAQRKRFWLDDGGYEFSRKLDKEHDDLMWLGISIAAPVIIGIPFVLWEFIKALIIIFP